MTNENVPVKVYYSTNNQIMLKKILLLSLIFLPQILPAQKATISEELRELVTYPFSDPNPLPILTEKSFKIYPYHSFDGYSVTSQIQKWKVVKLENDYIEVYVLPETGGKVWGAIEKSTGKEFIYRNEVMKFRNISLRGPWTSGGIEFNFGYIGHTPSTANPVDYMFKENSDGSVSCFVGNIDLPSRTQWRVEIRLPKDKAYFETRVSWNNPTPVPQSYYNWMTAAAVVSDDLEFFYPGNTELDHDGSAGSWPIDKEGHDLSKYKNNAFGTDRSSHVVGEYNDFMGGYYHASEFGFGHWALYDDMPGRKLWLWAQSRSGAIWEDLLTDTNGQYMEFQAGRTFNQYAPSPVYKSPISQVPFPPGLTDRWSEIWFPVKEIGGLRDVSPLGVLNVTNENGHLLVGINALSVAQAKVTIKSDDKVLYSEEHLFKPMDVFKTSVIFNDTANYEVVAEGMDLRFGTEKKNLLTRPFVTSLPIDKTTSAYLYREGIQLKENRNYKLARGYFYNCLKKDSQYIDAMASLTELFYRSNQYDSALYYAAQALQLDAYHPAANYFAGITYRAQGNLINALETLGWAARSPEYRSVAYSQMAGIELQLNDLNLGERYAKLALTYDGNSFNALKILAVIYRLRGNEELATGTADQISLLDPINHFADFERYLMSESDENFSRFTSSIKNEFPYQTYMELAIDYYNLGQKYDALRVLEKAPVHPLVILWKAFLNDDLSLLDEVTKATPAFVFPFRTETSSALSWAVAHNSHWKFKYFLGLNYWAIQRENEARDLFMACRDEPDYAFFYLSRAYLVKMTDEKQELKDLQSGKRLAPDNWRTWIALIGYYENICDYKTALALSTEAVAKFKGNFNLALQLARVQLNNGDYNKCIKTLEKTNIIPFEGSSQGKLLYEQAYMLLSLELMNVKKYQEAVVKLEKSKEWPENLGVGKPYRPDNRMQDYIEAFCVDKLGRSDEATALRNSIINYSSEFNDNSRPSFNDILVLWILRDRGETDVADAMIEKMENSKQTTSPVRQWVISSYKNDSAKCSELEPGLRENTYLKITRRIMEITNQR
jgi:tetratricopeptide (TPR) repeat protein